MTIDDLILEVGNRAISGWTEIRVTRGVERCPSDFEIELTERAPDQAQSVVVNPGDSCIVKLGDDVVVTGYIDKSIPTISARGHSIRVIGRGKCQDLVDCSAKWPGSQISGASALGIAQRLAKPYGIDVYAADMAQVGPGIPQFNLTLGETAWDVIERVSRYAALLAYEDAGGRLVLSRVGTTKAASGVEQGQNVQRASIVNAMDERYSHYEAFLLSMDGLTDIGAGGNLLIDVPDPNVPRYRNLYMIAEGGGLGLGADVARQRARWEARRRAGRAREVIAEIDSWRDSAGALWQPNTLAMVDLPALKLPATELAITQVTYRLSDDRGTTAALTLMAPDALLPEPILLQPFPADLPAGIGAN